MSLATGRVTRSEWFDRVGSTNDVVRDWLAEGTPGVCLAVADEQTTGRGRNGRSWVAPPGAALLLSLGFRPAGIAPGRAWQVAAVVALAMAEAVEESFGLMRDTVLLKWPNDLVVVYEGGHRGADDAGGVRKLAGVLGESAGLGTADPTVIVGIGVNGAWHPDRFPTDLRSTMTSLHEVSGGMPVDRPALVAAFVAALEPRLDALDEGVGLDDWERRQVTTGRVVAIETAAGTEVASAVGVDADSGALLIAGAGGARPVLVGDIRHVRLGPV